MLVTRTKRRQRKSLVLDARLPSVFYTRMNYITAQEMSEHQAYSTNDLNQYTAINGFTPTYDAEGNQTRLQTSTGIWRVEYNAQNRVVRFDEETSSGEEGTSVACAYDYMGRRFEKRVEQHGQVTLHQRYLYRDYLQIAATTTRWTAGG